MGRHGYDLPSCHQGVGYSVISLQTFVTPESVFSFLDWGDFMPVKVTWSSVRAALFFRVPFHDVVWYFVPLSPIPMKRKYQALPIITALHT